MRSSRPASRSRFRNRIAAGTAAVLTGLITACTASIPDPQPSEASDSAARAATDLAAGLVAKDLNRVEFVGAESSQVDAQFKPLIRGMGAISPAVSVGSVAEQGANATATLNYSWAFPGLQPAWTYATKVQLARDAGRWKTAWQPLVVAPELDGSNRLTEQRLAADRGELLGADGAPIMVLRPVVRIGVDKSQVSAAQAATSAARLAKLVDVDPKPYVRLVKAAGERAFVEAITYRSGDKDRPKDKSVIAIPGARPVDAQQMLAPNRTFARALIGTVGPSTKEIVDASSGAVVAGDQVGLSGLQKRYDVSLRGRPGVRVQLVPTTTGGASPAPTPTTGSSGPKPTTLFEVKPVAGTTLNTTLRPSLQKAAEATLRDVKPASAIVAIRPSTGEVLAAANGPGSSSQATATVGQYPPGSTFKIVTSLALLRAGLKPTSRVTCPSSVTVDGKKFTNYSDYPSSSAGGSIDLRTALAQSCNTAFIGQRGKINHDDLEAAAASLGLGADYDTGFPSFFGSVPNEPNAAGDAAALIGQAKVEASPLAIAAVVASVAHGRTVVPHLVEGSEPKSTAKPLTATEAKQLQTMMGSVVSEGSGRLLQDLAPPAVIAKTGTAEYGKGPPFKTHVWMVAAQGDLAVAVFVSDGESGSKTAGPLLKTFLSRAR